jgi:phenylacetate-CoA ligase
LTTRARWAAHIAAQAPRQGRFPFRSREAIERERDRRLRGTVAHAYQHVPYYRETMRRLGVYPAEIATAGDLGRLPIIERDQLQHDPEYFVSGAEPLERYLELRSAGSSGRPVTVFHHAFAMVEGACHRERARSLVIRRAGRRLRIRELRISPPRSNAVRTAEAYAALGVLPARVRYTAWRRDLGASPDEHVAAIDDLRPDVISSYGSGLAELFVHLHAQGTGVRLPPVAVYSADALAPSERRLIEDGFGVEVIGLYQAIEAFHIGFECEAHRGYHVNSDIHPLRIVDPEGRDVPAGEPGDVAVSNLVNRGTVLLNYRLGDSARLVRGACSCGRSLPLLELENRCDERLSTVAGRTVGPVTLRTAFNDEPGVVRFQIVQRARDHVQVSVVLRTGERAAGETGARLVSKLSDLLGAGTRVELSFTDSLVRTRGGKVRAVVPQSALAALADERPP